MKKKTLTLNRKTDQSTKPVDHKAEAVVEADPEKRFLNGVAVHPSPGMRLELGSEQPSVRAIDLITPIGMEL